MSVVRKARVGWTILRREGPAAVARVLSRYGRSAPRDGPSEGALVFDALGADRRPGFMVDVGAHVGGTLSRFARNGWHVWAFEPDAANRQRLVERFGRYPTVSVDARALAAREMAAAAFYNSPQSTGISGLSAFDESHQSAGTVEVTTLERVLEDRPPPAAQIDFLKIDTEGFDLFVLQGLPWTRWAPRVILCEFGDLRTQALGYDYHALARFLVDRGYRVIVSEWQPVTRFGGPHEWRCFAVYPHQLQDARAWGNLLAARDESLFEDLLRRCGLRGCGG